MAASGNPFTSEEYVYQFAQYNKDFYELKLYQCYIEVTNLNIENVISAIKQAGLQQAFEHLKAKIETKDRKLDAALTATFGDINAMETFLGKMKREGLKCLHPDHGAQNEENFKAFNNNIEYLQHYCQTHCRVLQALTETAKKDSQFPFNPPSHAFYTNFPSQYGSFSKSKEEEFPYVVTHSTLTVSQIDKKSAWFKLTNKYEQIRFWLSEIIRNPGEGFAPDVLSAQTNGRKYLNLLLAVFGVEPFGFKPTGGVRSLPWAFLHKDVMTSEQYKTLIDELLEVLDGCITRRPSVVRNFIEGLIPLMKARLSSMAGTFEITKKQVDLIRVTMKEKFKPEGQLDIQLFHELSEAARKQCFEYHTEVNPSPAFNRPQPSVPPQQPPVQPPNDFQRQEEGQQKKRKVDNVPPYVPPVQQSQQGFFRPAPLLVDPSTNPKIVFRVLSDPHRSAAEAFMMEMSNDKSLHGIIYLAPTVKAKNQQLFTPMIYYKKTVYCLESAVLQPDVFYGRTTLTEGEYVLLEKMAKESLKQLWTAQFVTQPAHTSQVPKSGNF